MIPMDYECSNGGMKLNTITRCHGYLTEILLIVSALLLSFVSVPGYASSGDQGSATAVFLKLDPSSRSSAMGSMRGGLRGDAFAASHNPAGLGYVQQSDAAFTHVDIFEGVSYNHASMVSPIDEESSWGLGYTGIDYGNQSRTEVGSGGSSDPRRGLGNFGADDYSFGLSYGRELLQRQRLGAHLKYVGTQIAGFDDSTFSFDMGWAYQVSPTLKVGVSGKNLIGNLQLNEKSDPLPRTYDLGMTWHKTMKTMSVELNFHGALPEDADAFMSVGGEWGWRDTLFLRAGYNGEKEVDEGLTFGGGLQWRKFGIDYSFEDFGELGEQTKLSISYQF